MAPADRAFSPNPSLPGDAGAHSAAGQATISVEVAHAPSGGSAQCMQLLLPLGATVADALRASGWCLPVSGGVWSPAAGLGETGSGEISQDGAGQGRGQVQDQVQAPRLVQDQVAVQAPRSAEAAAFRPGQVLPADWRLSVWGRWVTLDHPLRERDRLEILRPLRVDPKEARRQRYAQHQALLKRLKPAGQRRRSNG
jgi:putative ubiquitin-RnfH superfamily antitoxin RatB of RatAB toxin-antitoxin module